MITLPSTPIRTRLAAGAGRATAALSKTLGRGEGSVIGGRVSLVLDPKSLERLAKWRTIALVSGTNGKTTTTTMIAAALRTRGPVVTNVAGSNMFGGMVSALSSSPAHVGVLETDEGHLPKALSLVKPHFVVLLNLSRDQLDRVGEVRMQAKKWRNALEGSSATVIANADDPMVVWAAGATSAVWVAAGNSWRLDAASCPSCGSRIDWTGGEWSCTGCPLKRPSPHAFITSTMVANRRVGADVRLPLDLKLPGEVNRRNAAIALTTAVMMGAEPSSAQRAVASLAGAAGRFTSARIGGVTTRLILAKNPAGWTEALRLVRSDGSPLVIAINARVQDGRDPSWLWDVPFEQLQGRFIVATGERGRDLAVRLLYAGVDHELVDDLTGAVRAAFLRADHPHKPETEDGHSGHGLTRASALDSSSDDRNESFEIDLVANYSAFQEFRSLAAE